MLALAITLYRCKLLRLHVAYKSLLQLPLLLQLARVVRLTYFSKVDQLSLTLGIMRSGLVKAVLILEKVIVSPNALFEKASPVPELDLFNLVVCLASCFFYCFFSVLTNPGCLQVSTASIQWPT